MMNLRFSSGKEKAEIISEMINGDITPDVPVSILQLHPDVTLILDKEAASELREENLRR
jgi:glucosamine-6-phosphate deaminase